MKKKYFKLSFPAIFGSRYILLDPEKMNPLSEEVLMIMDAENIKSIRVRLELIELTEEEMEEIPEFQGW